MEKLPFKENDLYNEALVLMKSNKVKKAMSILDKAILLDNTNVNILNLMGICHYMYCNFNSAKYYFEKSVAIDNSNRAVSYIEGMNSNVFIDISIKYKYALEFIKNEKFREATILLEEIKLLNKELIPPYEILYLLYMNSGEKEKALESIKIAYSLDNSNISISAYYNYIILQELKRTEKIILANYYLWIGILSIIIILLSITIVIVIKG